MNITVSPEELRAHEDALLEWQKARQEVFVENLVVESGGNHDVYAGRMAHMHFAGSSVERAHKAVAEWEKSCPPPKLIPNV